MSDMSAEDRQAIPMPGRGNAFLNQLQEKASRNTNLTLQDIKPLIDDALMFLKNVTDYATKEVADVLNMLYFVPDFLMNEKFSSIHVIDINKRSFDSYKVGNYLLQNNFHKSVVHITRFLHDMISNGTSNTLEAQCQYNLFHLYRLIAHFTHVYPVKDTSFCRAICTEGFLDILKLSLVYFDDPFNKLPYTVDGYNLTAMTKKYILGILGNCISLCPDNRTIYQQAKIIDTLARIDKLTEDVKLTVLLIVAYTVDGTEPNKMLSNSTETVIYLVKTLKKAVHSANHYCITGGFGLSSIYLLEGLNILSSNNDGNKLAILKHGGIQVIIRMLHSDFSEDEIQLATKTLQNLAVVKKIRKEIASQLNKSGKYTVIPLCSFNTLFFFFFPFFFL